MDQFSPTSKKAGFATRAIHHGYDPRDHDGALTPPVHFTSTFSFETAQQGGEMFAGDREGYIYSRIGNPTVNLLEERMASLEGGEAGLAFASGMGAITSACWTFLKPGDEVLTDMTLYGCTFAFFNHGLAKFGITVRHVDMTDVGEVAKALSDQTKIVYFETPANPNMRLVDIKAVSELVHKVGARVIVDNTYATPVLTRPLELGADMVVHSATKYLGGHGDLLAGLAVGSLDDMTEMRVYGLKDMTGAAMAPMTAMLILRGLKTLQLRMDRHCQSAFQIADFLTSHERVEQVYFPGLPDFPQHDLAVQQMAKFGGMIAFEVAGGLEGGIKVMNKLSMIQRAVSFGDAETLIQHPASMTHSTYSEEERAKHGISEGLIRLSVGLEEVDDILQDLAQALA